MLWVCLVDRFLSSENDDSLEITDVCSTREINILQSHAGHQSRLDKRVDLKNRIKNDYYIKEMCHNLKKKILTYVIFCRQKAIEERDELKNVISCSQWNLNHYAWIKLNCVFKNQLTECNVKLFVLRGKQMKTMNCLFHTDT